MKISFLLLFLIPFFQASASNLEAYLNGDMTREEIAREIFSSGNVADELNDIEVDIQQAAQSGVPLIDMVPLANYLNKEVISYNSSVSRNKMIVRLAGTGLGMAIGYFGFRTQSGSSMTMDFGIPAMINIAVTTLGAVSGYTIAAATSAIFMDDSVDGLDIDEF